MVLPEIVVPKLNVADEAVTPRGPATVLLVAPTQNGAELYPLLAKVNPQLVAVPDHVILPTTFVELGFITGVVPQVPTVGVVPLEIILPPF